MLNIIDNQDDIMAETKQAASGLGRGFDTRHSGKGKTLFEGLGRGESKEEAKSAVRGKAGDQNPGRCMQTHSVALTDHLTSQKAAKALTGFST